MNHPTVPAILAGLNPDEPPLQVRITCTACTHRYQPGPGGYRAGRTSCPECRGWTFTAALQLDDAPIPFVLAGGGSDG